MKKILCLILALTLSLCLFACGGDDVLWDEDTDGVRGEINSGSTDADTDSDTDSDTDAGADAEVDFSLGDTADNSYVNDFLGISCTLPGDWEFYTDAEILALNNLTGEYLEDDILDQLKDATIIYDMYASAEGGAKSVSVNMQKFSPVQIASINIKQVLESQIDTLKTTFENMGYSNIEASYAEVTVDGETFDGLALTAKIGDLTFYSTMFSFVRGNYLASVSIGLLGDDTTETVLGYFEVA